MLDIHANPSDESQHHNSHHEDKERIATKVEREKISNPGKDGEADSSSEWKLWATILALSILSVAIYRLTMQKR